MVTVISKPSVPKKSGYRRENNLERAKRLKQGNKPATGAGGKPLVNVESGGKVYPTTNPDFVPNPNPTKKIDFGTGIPKAGGGTIKVTTQSGQEFELSKEEYLGQFVTPKTMELDQALAEEKFQRSPEGQLEAEKTALEGQTKTTEGLFAADEANVLAGNLERDEARRASVLTNLKESGKDFLTTAANTIDSIRTSVTGNAPKRVAKAQREFSSAEAILISDMELVRSGDKKLSVAMKDFDLAISAINRLESETTLKGKFNSGWWEDEGADIEAQIIEEKRTIENLRTEMINAAAMANVGARR